MTGREIKVSGAPGSSVTQVQYQTVGGTWMTIDVNWGTATVFGLTYNIDDHACAYVSYLHEDTFPVVRSIVLPVTEPGIPGRQFTFSYNSDTTDSVNYQYRPGCGESPVTVTSSSHGWGELSRMITPSGAQVDYSYSLDGVPNVSFAADRIPRANVAQKKITHDGGTMDTWTYAVSETSSSVTAPDGSSTIEYFFPHDPAKARHFAGSNGKGGLVYRSDHSDKMRVERQWTFRIFDGANSNSPNGMVSFNTVVDTEYTSLMEGGNPVKMSAKKFQYDFNGNVTQVTEYDWFDPALVSRDGNGVPTAVPGSATELRTTTTGYYNAASASSSPNVYSKRAIATATPLVLSAPQQTVIGLSQTQFSYDTQAYGTAPTIGNLTQVSALDDQAGVWRNTTYGYDGYGNKTTITDPNNNVTNIVYDPVTRAQPTQVTVNPLNGAGTQTTTPVYDYSTGLVTSVTDANNQTKSTDYTNQRLGTVDPFGRPGVVTGPQVTSVAGGVTYPNQQRKVKFTYYDDARQTVVESDLNQTGDYKLKARASHDQLGRVVKAEGNEDGTANYTIFAQTVYVNVLGTGRVTKTTNPKRDAAAATTDGWTRATSDLLGRVIEVATFSGTGQPPDTGPCSGSCTGKVTTSFYSNQTTVTDQAGKMRRSVTDGLGRLAQVIEDPNGLNYQTNYFYDTLSNLRKVEQGEQKRWFAYDSLSRLIYAMNPEQTANAAFVYTDNTVSPPNSQWSMKYTYQANGNLATRTDARNITTTYGYDGLNRNTTVDYSDSTPDITHTYDTATLGKGRLRKTETAGGAGSRVTINAYDAMGRPLSQGQQFFYLGAWGSSYTTQHAYNLAGGVTLQTYPSGRTTTTNYDAAGRLNTFSGNLGVGGAPSNYVTGTTVYTATGQMTQEQFGTTTALYHRQHFTSRGQMYDVRLGTGATDDFSNATWNRGALRTYYSSDYTLGNGGVNINGNVYRQDHFVPLNDAVSDWVMSVNYHGYDPLNRITGISEAGDSYIGGVFQETYPYSQNFNYDRYGNRVLISGSSTATSGPGATSIKDTVWVEDALPAGATAGSDGGDGWTWVSGNPSPVSGSSAHQSNVAAGQHQHFFYGATATLPVNTGDKLYAYVYLDPANMPSEVMLQWNENGSWEHRAYWGANNIAYGVDGTVSRRNMGSLPPNGGWMRLEVAASLVGLEAKTVNGMAFTLYGGRATWDRAGKSAQQTGGSINNLPLNVDPARNRLLPPGGVMQYDAAGNLSNDTYTTPLLGQRNYDAENKMTAVYNGSGVLQDSYYYDGDGRRARRVIIGVETWQIYGIGGELVAEYAAGGATNAPQKEYGYRGGQLLITAESNGTVKWLVGESVGDAADGGGQERGAQWDEWRSEA